MVNAVFPVLLLATFLQSGHSQHLGLGSCPKISGMDDFDLNSYLGTWYQYGSWGTGLQGKGRCVKSEYKYNSDTGFINLIKTQVPLNRITKPEIHGRVTLMNPSKTEGKLLMIVDLPVFGIVEFPVWVLGTDYMSWSVTYSCIDLKLFHFKASWITTRDRSPSPYFEEEMNGALKKIGLTTAKYKKTDHTNCE